MRIEDRTAIVTGAGQGIGREIAIELAREGANVAICDLKEESEHHDRTATEVVSEDGLRGDCFFYEGDVTDATDVKTLVDTTVDRYGGLDILVNNAGIFPYEITSQTIEEISEDNWDAVMEVNLKGVYLCCKYALPYLKRSDSGRIINLSSKMGLVGHDGGAAYAASKGGLISLTKQLAVDYGEEAICVNAICPGTIITGTKLYRLEEQEETRREGTLLPYLGEGEDVSRAVVYLASDDAKYMTGQVLVLDGGWTAH